MEETDRTPASGCATITAVAVERGADGAPDLIEVRTAGGLVGRGEGEWREDLLCRRPELVIGRSPFEVEAIFDDLAAGGLDIALWDLQGKLLDTPVCRLLGKPYRSRVEVRQSLPETHSAPVAAGLELPLDTLVRELIQHKRLDIALQDVARCGLTGLRRLAYLCWVFRVRLAPCCAGALTGAAAVLHAAACIPPVSNAISAPPVFVVIPGEPDALLPVPEGAGLGVELPPLNATLELGSAGASC